MYVEAPFRGEGLARAVLALVEGPALPLPVREVCASMNGERYWAREWGVSLMRNRPAFADDHGLHHPADCVGDVGAACGPLLAGLAALGIAEGYRRSPCLVYAASDDGARLALGVAAASSAVGGPPRFALGAARDAAPRRSKPSPAAREGGEER